MAQHFRQASKQTCTSLLGLFPVFSSSAGLATGISLHPTLLENATCSDSSATHPSLGLTSSTSPGPSLNGTATAPWELLIGEAFWLALWVPSVSSLSSLSSLSVWLSSDGSGTARDGRTMVPKQSWLLPTMGSLHRASAKSTNSPRDSWAWGLGFFSQLGEPRLCWKKAVEAWRSDCIRSCSLSVLISLARCRSSCSLSVFNSSSQPEGLPRAAARSKTGRDQKCPLGEWTSWSHLDIADIADWNLAGQAGTNGRNTICDQSDLVKVLWIQLMNQKAVIWSGTVQIQKKHPRFQELKRQNF